MEELYQGIISLLKKFPFGERFMAHSGQFIVGAYVIWVILMAIVFFGLYKGEKFKETRFKAGFLLLLVFSSLLFLFIFKLLTKYN